MRMFWLLIAVLAFVASGSVVQAQEKLDYRKVNLDELLTETQKGSPDPNAVVVVWWVPDEFWLVSFAQDDTISEKEVKAFMDIVSRYTVVGVADGTIGPLGGITYKSDEETRKRIRIRDSQGIDYGPLAEKQIDADARTLSAMLRTMFAEELGIMGENMRFYCFPAKAKDGSKLASPSQPGKFLMKLGDEELRWKLPLESLLVSRSCPKCGENLHGGYNYCPWDGTKLP